jgi:hypothetical protein
MNPDSAEFAAGLATSNAAKEQYESADSVLRQFSTRLGVSDPETGFSPLQLLRRASRLRRILQSEGHPVFFLFAEAVLAGGSVRTVRNVFRSLFWANGLDVAAGLLASYGLISRNGEILSSGVVSSGRGFVSVDALHNGAP